MEILSNKLFPFNNICFVSPSSLGWVLRRLRSSLRSSRSGWLCNASRSVALPRRLRSPSSLAASLANSLALSYRDYVLAMRVELTATTSTWLTTQVDAQRLELERSEEAIQDFVVEHDLQSLTIAAWRNQGAERVAELTSALDTKERERVAAEAKLSDIEEWVEEGKPANYWLPGFHFTTGFLTGVK